MPHNYDVVGFMAGWGWTEKGMIGESTRHIRMCVLAYYYYVEAAAVVIIIILGTIWHECASRCPLTNYRGIRGKHDVSLISVISSGCSAHFSKLTIHRVRRYETPQ